MCRIQGTPGPPNRLIEARSKHNLSENRKTKPGTTGQSKGNRKPGGNEVKRKGKRLDWDVGRV